MGRKLKYKTPEELRIAKNSRNQEYYERNKEKIKKKNLKRYHKAKNERVGT